MGLLDGHRGIVTGGGSGMGAATCRRIVEEGGRVAVVDLDGDRAEKVAREVDGLAYQADVRDYAALQAAVDDAAAKLGGLSLAYNNAGIGNMMPMHDWPLDEWHRIVDVNLTGVFHGFKATVPHLLANGDGRVVSTASISGNRPAAGEAPYSAAKAAVMAITQNAALEYAPTIRCNSVSPGMIRTAMTNTLLDDFPGMQDFMLAKTPAARIGTPEDIADVVVFLMSDMSRFVNGQNIVVDGGMILHGSGIDGVMERLHTRVPPAG